mmetsp:Transcript_2553/g.7764  ORF Transcript_2553/g.7764 Transcript_2553/m.7764 type:complete len:242 (-) Transcript_2553:475-1200(-)
MASMMASKMASRSVQMLRARPVGQASRRLLPHHRRRLLICSRQRSSAKRAFGSQRAWRALRSARRILVSASTCTTTLSPPKPSSSCFALARNSCQRQASERSFANTSAWPLLKSRTKPTSWRTCACRRWWTSSISSSSAARLSRASLLRRVPAPRPRHSAPRSTRRCGGTTLPAELGHTGSRPPRTGSERASRTVTALSQRPFLVTLWLTSPNDARKGGGILAPSRAAPQRTCKALEKDWT